MDKQKVLITGGAGFLGINLIRHLGERGYTLASLYVEEFDYPERGRVETIKGDIRDKVLARQARASDSGQRQVKSLRSVNAGTEYVRRLPSDAVTKFSPTRQLRYRALQSLLDSRPN